MGSSLDEIGDQPLIWVRDVNGVSYNISKVATTEEILAAFAVLSSGPEHACARRILSITLAIHVHLL